MAKVDPLPDYRIKAARDAIREMVGRSCRPVDECPCGHPSSVHGPEGCFADPREDEAFDFIYCSCLKTGESVTCDA